MDHTIPSSFSLLKCSRLALIAKRGDKCFNPIHGVLTGLGPVNIKISYIAAPNAQPRNGDTMGI